ncbi:Rib/alpha-like domain-containing protein, partial [Clostridium perfringens]
MENKKITQKARFINNSEKKPKYKVRKLSIGVVSFLYGFSIFYGGTITANAQEIETSQQGVILEQNIDEKKREQKRNEKDIEPRELGTNNIVQPKEETENNEDEGNKYTFPEEISNTLDSTGFRSVSKKNIETSNSMFRSTPQTYDIIYVNNSGNGNGEKETTPMNDLYEALKKVSDNGKIVLTGNITYRKPLTFSKNVTIEGSEPYYTLLLNEDLTVDSNIVLKNLIFNIIPEGTKVPSVIVNGHFLTMNNVRTSNNRDLIPNIELQGNNSKLNITGFTEINEIKVNNGADIYLNSSSVKVKNGITVLSNNGENVNVLSKSNFVSRFSGNENSHLNLTLDSNYSNLDLNRIYDLKLTNNAVATLETENANSITNKLTVDSNSSLNLENNSLNIQVLSGGGDIRLSSDSTVVAQNADPSVNDMTITFEKIDTNYKVYEGKKFVEIVNKDVRPTVLLSPINKQLEPNEVGNYVYEALEAVTEKEATLQPLGGWTDTNFAELPSNLGDKPAPNQGAGKVIEYSTEEWNKSDNYNTFGWKPIDGGKIAFSKDGFNAINRPGGAMSYQDGFVGASIPDNRSGNNNLLILANYQDKNNFKGVYREVDVTGEREIAFKSNVSGLTLLPSGDKFKVRFVNAETNTEIANHIIETAQTTSTNRVVMLPEGTNRVRVELIPLYNQTQIGNFPQWRYNSFVNQFELFRGSKMEDALPDSEKTQLFRNDETGTYKFTVKDNGQGEKGTDGRLSIAPYYGNQNTVIDRKLNAGVDLSFEETIENGAVLVDKNGDANSKVVSDLKPTLYENGLNTQDAKIIAGESKELALKTIDLTKKNFERPTEILVTDYKLNYGTRNYSINGNKADNPYINRVGTENDSPYRQDVVANSQEAAAKYGNQVTSKTVLDNATGRKIIILMNKTKLRDSIEAENIKQLNKDDYTAESWAKYQAALARANAIINENETSEYLSEDTATKLAKMASQRDINDLSELLPMILVKAPTLTAENNGNIIIAPSQGASKLEVTYNDGIKDIIVEAIREKIESTEENVQPTYTWKINNVITGTEQGEIIPEGVSIDKVTGSITILEPNVKDSSTVTAKDYSETNDASKEISILAKDVTAPSAPTVIANKNGTVTVTPPAEADVKNIEITYTDNQDTNCTVTIAKGEDNRWSLIGENTGITLNDTTGVVTIQDSSIKADTEVKAKAKDISDNESTESSTRITYTQKYDPTVSAGSVSVNKDNVKTPEQKETLKTDILNKVTVPEEAGDVTKEIQGDLPTEVGSHQVPVKVTYADGTEDTVNVTVDITETQAQKDTAITASPVSYKSNVSASDRENAIKNAVTTTTEGVEITNKEITGDIPTDYTDGQLVNVAVTVTYKDGSTKVVEVPVTVTQTDSQKYDPTVSAGSVSVNKDNVKTPEQKETLKT